MDHFPRDRGVNKKYMSCHHLESNLHHLKRNMTGWKKTTTLWKLYPHIEKIREFFQLAILVNTQGGVGI